jgi:CelD/BcsL family acetyltransferase involved in cellulose biosynthesis
MNIAPSAPDLEAAEPTVFRVAVEPAFDFAGAQYRSLHQRSNATVFQSPRWLDALHRDLAPAFGAEPVTVTVRDQSGWLLLVLPLVRRRQRGVTTLEFADLGPCDYNAVVYDPDEAALLDADATLPQRIAAVLPRHDVLALDKLTGDDPLLDRLFADTSRSPMRQSAYPTRLGGDWNTWRTAKVDNSLRRELDMKRRKLARSGNVQFLELRDPDAIERAFEALRRYRAARFKTIGAPDVLNNPIVFAFYRTMAIDGAREGFARTQALYLSGEPIAVQFGLVRNGVYSMLMIGPDIARHKRLSPGLLAIDDALRASFEAGDKIYDFTIGDHPYKLQFGAQAIPLYEWHRAPTFLGRTALLTIMLEREAKRVLRPLFKPRRAVQVSETESGEKPRP